MKLSSTTTLFTKSSLVRISAAESSPGRIIPNTIKTRVDLNFMIFPPLFKVLLAVGGSKHLSSSFCLGGGRERLLIVRTYG
jgi:hypothetical protein